MVTYLSINLVNFVIVNKLKYSLFHTHIRASEMEASKDSGEKHEVYVIFVNKKQLKIPQRSLTGEEILTKAGYDQSQYDLFLIHGQQSEQVQPTESVDIKNGLHFNAILKSAPYG
jgi:hypothetical protein